MSEASAMEENNDWNNLGCAEGIFEINSSPLSGVAGGWLVNSVEKAGGSIDMIERENPVNWDCICRQFPVKKLGEFPVE